jgi:hypothetical protein
VGEDPCVYVCVCAFGAFSVRVLLGGCVFVVVSMGKGSPNKGLSPNQKTIHTYTSFYLLFFRPYLLHYTRNLQGKVDPSWGRWLYRPYCVGSVWAVN